MRLYHGCMFKLLVPHRVNVRFPSRFLLFFFYEYTFFVIIRNIRLFLIVPPFPSSFCLGCRIYVVSHSIFSAYNVLLKFISSSICCFSKKDSLSVFRSLFSEKLLLTKKTKSKFWDNSSEYFNKSPRYYCY